jgi:hypothetical protein
MDKANYPNTMYLRAPMNISYGWSYKQTTLPAGLSCTRADNLPPDESGRPYYWVNGHGEQDNVVLDGWMETYGVRVSMDDVQSLSE